MRSGINLHYYNCGGLFRHIEWKKESFQYAMSELPNKLRNLIKKKEVD